VRRLASPLAVLLLALPAAGCGAERVSVPDVDLRPGEPTKRVEYPRAGIAARVPARYPAQARPRPGVFRVVIADAVLSAWAYPREEQLPRTDAELEKARDELEGEVERRGGDFELDRARTTKVDGARAVELLGRQTVGQERLRTRSVHVYKGSAEYVFELLAPRARFDRLDSRAFEPMLDSLELSGKVRAKKSG